MPRTKEAFLNLTLRKKRRELSRIEEASEKVTPLGRIKKLKGQIQRITMLLDKKKDGKDV